ncbi:hypothetical protein GOP47_0025845 [Adiantum capillus-veneris]|uniref:VQ domain-containing protein n=1 Tax=Adiantum capillus-veneris TaxID=13818 RepID=A0A9D4U0U8_ADICA|nr:hypothetical protein GOP47_0025845 [Adiantum capillus-veneris]
MEEKNRSVSMLKNLDGAIAKQRKLKRRNAADNCSVAEQGLVRRNKIQPLIIHAVNPPLIHAEPSTFMRIVQSLTGCPETQLRCGDEEEMAAAAVATGRKGKMEELMSSPSMCSCSLLLDSNEHNVVFVDSPVDSVAASPHEEFLCFEESSDDNVLLWPPAQNHHLESTLDSYLEHLLSSYDRNAYCRFTSNSAFLADVCDPMLLKELS